MSETKLNGKYYAFYRPVDNYGATQLADVEKDGHHGHIPVERWNDYDALQDAIALGFKLNLETFDDGDCIAAYTIYNPNCTDADEGNTIDSDFLLYRKKFNCSDEVAALLTLAAQLSYATCILEEVRDWLSDTKTID